MKDLERIYQLILAEKKKVLTDLERIEENVKRVIARPFSGAHEKMYQYLGKGFRLDCQKVYKWLDTEPQSREKEVLEYQLRRYEKKEVL